MDDRRFDQMTRLLASGTSRRALIKGLLGLAGAAVTGGVLLESDTDAARRPANPTPTPVRCPGQQIAVGGQCTCPSGFDKCGPDCCPQGSAVCCDNACCYGACYGEELCCAGAYCEAGGCCGAGQDCCADAGCCDGVCYLDPANGQELCCALDRFCAVTAECCDNGWACCLDEGCCLGECYDDAQGLNVCCPAGIAEVCGNDCCAIATHVCCTQADGSKFCAPIEVGCNPPEPECDTAQECGIGQDCCNGVCAFCCSDDGCNSCQACEAGHCTPAFAHPCGDICCDSRVNGVCCIGQSHTTGICCPGSDAFGNEFRRCCADSAGDLFCGYPCCDDDDCSRYCLEGRCVECLQASQCSLSPGSLGQLCCDNTCYEGDCCDSSECQPGETCLANVCTPVAGP